MLKSEFLVNNKVINFDLRDSYYDQNRDTDVFRHPIIDKKFPYSLKEGEIAVTKINARHLALSLRERNYEGKVNLVGRYNTAHKKRYMSEPIEFNINEWFFKE